MLSIYLQNEQIFRKKIQFQIKISEYKKEKKFNAINLLFENCNNWKYEEKSFRSTTSKTITSHSTTKRKVTTSSTTKKARILSSTTIRMITSQSTAKKVNKFASTPKQTINLFSATERKITSQSTTKKTLPLTKTMTTLSSTAKHSLPSTIKRKITSPSTTEKMITLLTKSTRTTQRTITLSSETKQIITSISIRPSHTTGSIKIPNISITSTSSEPLLMTYETSTKYELQLDENSVKPIERSNSIELFVFITVAVAFLTAILLVFYLREIKSKNSKLLSNQIKLNEGSYKGDLNEPVYWVIKCFKLQVRVKLH